MNLKASLFFALTLCFAITSFALATGDTPNHAAATHAMTAEQLLDVITSCRVPSDQTVLAADLGLEAMSLDECPLDFACAMACQAQSHSCTIACPGYPNNIPAWQACLAGCWADEDECAEGCCLE